MKIVFSLFSRFTGKIDFNFGSNLNFAGLLDRRFCGKPIFKMADTDLKKNQLAVYDNVRA